MHRIDKESQVYREAQRRVREKAKFFKHLYTFAIVNIFLIFFSLFRGRPFMPFPVVIFWGVGLAFHYLKVFGFPGTGILSRDWEDREIRKEMDRMSGVSNPKEEVEEMELKELRKEYRDSDLV